MASKSTSYGSYGVIRRIRPLAGSFRYYPYTIGTISKKEDMKQVVITLGVKFSVYVAESMFLLCDDIRTMLGFCYKLWKYVINYRTPVLVMLLRVMHYVNLKHIKPKNGLYLDDGNSVQCELIKTIWEEIVNGIIVLHRVDIAVRRKVRSFDDRLLPSAIAKYEVDVLKKLECKLRSTKDVLEANGFARERIESDISDLWKGLFEEEASKEKRIGILSDLFRPLLGKPLHCGIFGLPICSPYILGKDFAMHELKEEVMLLGVEVSTYVVQSMFLLCDDIGTMLEFCYNLWKSVISSPNPVLDRLLCVMHYVYSKDIKPKNGVYKNDGNNSVIKTTWKDFADGIIILHRLEMALKKKVRSFDDRQILSAIEKYKLNVLKNLEDKLRSGKDGSDEVNGLARKTIESNIFDLWKSLFNETTTSKVMRSRIYNDLFTPILGKLSRNEILRLSPVCSPYILGKDFAMHELKEEVVRLGVELSLYVAESMFLLSDDIRTMIWFCYRVWNGTKTRVANKNIVVDRLLCVIHYVYTKYIKPKNGVYQNDGNHSVQYKLVSSTQETFLGGFTDLNSVVVLLRTGGKCGRERTTIIEEAVKKVEEKLWCVKDVSKANGFARDKIECNVLELWKSIFDKEIKEAALNLKAIKMKILRDLFLPLCNEVKPPTK